MKPNLTRVPKCGTGMNKKKLFFLKKKAPAHCISGISLSLGAFFSTQANVYIAIRSILSNEDQYEGIRLLLLRFTIKKRKFSFVFFLSLMAQNLHCVWNIPTKYMTIQAFKPADPKKISTNNQTTLKKIFADVQLYFSSRPFWNRSNLWTLDRSILGLEY